MAPRDATILAGALAREIDGPHPTILRQLKAQREAGRECGRYPIVVIMRRTSEGFEAWDGNNVSPFYFPTEGATFDEALDAFLGTFWLNQEDHQDLFEVIDQTKEVVPARKGCIDANELNRDEAERREKLRLEQAEKGYYWAIEEEGQ